MNLATLMADQGRVEEGWPHMQRAAAVARDNADVHNNLAAYLLRMGEELHSSFPTCTHTHVHTHTHTHTRTHTHTHTHTHMHTHTHAHITDINKPN